MEGHLGEHVWGELSGRTERRRTEYKDWDPWSLDYKPVVQKQYLPSKTKSVTREGEWKSTLDFHPSGMSGRVCPGALTGWFAPGADCRNSTAVTPVHIWFSTGNVQGSLGSLTKVSLRFTQKKILYRYPSILLLLVILKEPVTQRHCGDTGKNACGK